MLVFEREDGGPLVSWGSRARTDVALLNARDHRFVRVAVFKVEKWQPSPLKQVKGAGASATTSLTASDIAVTMFPVVHVKTGADAAEDQVLYTTAVAQGSDGTFAGAVALVNEALFMTNVFRFQVLPEKIFLWEGPLDCGRQKDMGWLGQCLALGRAWCVLLRLPNVKEGKLRILRSSFCRSWLNLDGFRLMLSLGFSLKGSCSPMLGTGMSDLVLA